MEFKKLFEPGKIGTMELRNRIVVPPMALIYTEGTGDRWWYTERYIKTLASWAKGGVGLIITAHTKAESTIDYEPMGLGVARLDREDYIRQHNALTEAVHRYGAKIAVQLSPGGGRICYPIPPERQPVGPSCIPVCFYPQLTTRELKVSEIEGLVEAYGEAADRAKRAGYDAIQVHCLAMLFDQFLTPLWNKRTDKYGGDLEGRMRFLLECIESVKSRVGADFPLIGGPNSDQKIEGGRSLEDTIKIVKRMQKVGIHALHIRTGCYDAMNWLVPPLYHDEGCGLPFAEPLRKAVNIPVIVEGKIGPELAERVLEEGKADFVGMGRQVLADPEWPKKAREGSVEDIRKCIHCNDGCLGRVLSLKPATCTINPEMGREDEYKIVPAAKPKKVLVAGGGPAGMEAARVAALRGHQVTLYEKCDRLGGHLIDASAPPFKNDIKSLLDWLTTQVKKAGVKVKLKKAVTLKTVEELKPEVVIAATGSTPEIPDVPGVKQGFVTTAVDVMLGKAKVGKEVIVVGGHGIGCETALYLAQMGKRVTIVHRREAIATDIMLLNMISLIQMLAANNVRWFTDMDLKEITAGGIIAFDKKERREQTFKADTVVLALGMLSDNKLYKELDGKVPELYAVGDMVEPRRILNAIHEGSHIAREI